MIAAVDTELCAAIPGWFEPPHGFLAIVDRFGKIQVDHGAVTTPGWEASNMIAVHESWMPRGKLYVNRQVWPMLKSAIEACLALDDGYQIKTLGCFAPRMQRGSEAHLSTHSWGIAIDLNADDNPLQVKGGPVIRDVPDAWVAEFQKRGFTWGGDFLRADCMHFQFCGGY